MKDEITILFGQESAGKMIDAITEIAPAWSLERFTHMLERMTLGLRFHITLIKQKHSPNQRNYYHLCVDLLAKHLGYTHDEMHDLCLRAAFGTEKRMLRFGKDTYMEMTVYRPAKRSSKLPVSEYSDLIEAMIRMAAFNDFVMPDPEHYRVDDRIAKQIRMQREVAGA